MNKRLAIFFLIVLVVLIAYNQFVVKPQMEKQKKELQLKKIDTPQKPPAQTTSVISPQTNKTAPVKLELPSQAISADQEEQSDFYTKVFNITFSNKGAVITSIKLMQYLDDTHSPLELIPRYSDMKVYPFTVEFNDAAVTALENNAFYKMTESTHLDARGRNIKCIEFTFNDAKGNYFEKKYSLDDGYLIHFEGHFIANGKIMQPVIYWAPGIQSITGKQKKDFGWGYKPAWGTIWKDNAIVKVNPKKTKNSDFKLENIQWSGIQNNFFLIAFLPNSPANITIFKNSVPSTTVEVDDNLIIYGIQQLNAETIQLDLYAGPKDPEVLKALGHNLPEAIDYGIFWFLAKMLLVALKFLFKYVGNYGLAIIILTVAIRILLYPLTFKSMESMKKMQQLQPQMQAIKEKYKKIPFNDPRKQKMNQETMELYKKHGVNPAGGCLPLLLQLPILWAFYSMLSVAIELRGQPFILWLADLSKPDPYYITPILMGATQFWQQKISPTSADPMQQRLMLIMPVFFTYIFLSAQSGLVIYWLFNNILSIIQQQYLTKKQANNTTKKK